jgi:hypothetical protein
MARRKPLLRTVPTSHESPPPRRSPEPLPSSDAWGGHLHATRVALAMAYEHASRGAGSLSANERILTRVCELRCALASGEWLGRLRTNRLNELASARFALNEVGAMGFAAYISETVAAVHRSNSVRHRDTLVSKLEQNLRAAGPDLDTLIARFAQSLLDAGGGSAEDFPERSASGGGHAPDSAAQADAPDHPDLRRSERSRRR